MQKRVLVPIATGFEEIEALTVVDILRRAGALVVLAAAMDESPVVGRSKISVIPDMSLGQALSKDPYDIIVLPGGLPNAHLLRDNERMISAIEDQLQRNGLLGAICAAPLALDKAHALDGRVFTSHPSVRDELPALGYRTDRVVNAGRVLTSRAAGTAMEFAFEIVRELFGEKKVEEINGSVLANLNPGNCI
jgi:protein deglycase